MYSTASSQLRFILQEEVHDVFLGGLFVFLEVASAPAKDVLAPDASR